MFDEPREIIIGLGVIARDAVVSTVDELVEKYGSVEAAQKQFDLLVKELKGDLKKAEKRGTTARTKAEREIKKNRTKIERELRTRRTKAERELKKNRTKAERELKAFRKDLDKQVADVRKEVEARTELVTATIDDVVASASKTATQVSNTVVERSEEHTSELQSH